MMMCVYSVFARVCAPDNSEYLFGHVAQTFVNTHTVNAQVVNEPLNQRPGKKGSVPVRHINPIDVFFYVC